jgi:hypothetical protein
MQLTRFAAAVLNATATPTRHQAPRSGHVPMRMSLPCRSAATPTNQPKWRHKAKPEASRLAGRSGKCSRARAAKQRGSHLLHGLVSRDTRFTCHCCDGQNLPGATIGFLLARFKWDFLCLTNHIVILRLEKFDLNQSKSHHSVAPNVPRACSAAEHVSEQSHKTCMGIGVRRCHVRQRVIRYF